MTYKLFLDDVREPHHVTWAHIHHDDGPWAVVRSYEEFVAHIEAHGLPYYVSFDHDLQDFQYNPDYQGMEERTGQHCAQWLVEYCRDRNLLRPRFAVHSMNPVGANRIWATMTGP